MLGSLTLDKIKSIIEANLVSNKNRGYEYNEDGATAVIGENLKSDSDLTAWKDSLLSIHEDVIINPETGEVTQDFSSPIEKSYLQANLCNLRDAIAQTLFDILTDADSSGENITPRGDLDPFTQPESASGGNRSAGSGNIHLELPDTKTITLKIGTKQIVIDKDTITINGITLGANTIKTPGNMIYEPSSSVEMGLTGVSSSANGTNVVTITTISGQYHGLVTGNVIVISGSSNGGILPNGSYTVTKLTESTFSVPTSFPPVIPSGSGTCDYAYRTTGAYLGYSSGENIISL